MKSAVFTCSLVVVLMALLTPVLLATPARAQGASQRVTFKVNTTADTHDANWGDGVCDDQQNRCSLRAAIEEADALPYGSTVTIVVPAGTYRLLKGVLRLSAHRTIVINGASSKTTLIEGNKAFRIMSLGSPNLSVQLSQLTIEGGYTAAGNGGGIENYGTLTVNSSTIRDNSTTNDHYGGGIYNAPGGILTVSNSTIMGNSANSLFGYGGGIDNLGTLSVNNSIFNDNKAGDLGGGIMTGYEGGGVASVVDSTFSNNKAIGNGGGIYNSGLLTVISSTFSSNTSGYVGGGIENIGTASVNNSTISNNTATHGGGGIENAFGTASVSNSTISGNSAPSSGNINNLSGAITLTSTVVANSKAGQNCAGPITEKSGYNLDSDGSCGFTQSSDLNKVDPMLGPLQNNGGPTQTMALLQGSKAIDWVNGSGDCPTTDQRGDVRPDDGESACDIGAYESAY